MDTVSRDGVASAFDETDLMGIIAAAARCMTDVHRAVRSYLAGEYDAGDDALAESGESLDEAHAIQTRLIQEEAGAERPGSASIILVHAQDHLMNAILARQMATWFKELALKVDRSGANT